MPLDDGRARFRLCPLEGRQQRGHLPAARGGLVRRGELPIRRPMTGSAVLDYAHGRESAAVEVAADRRSVVVDCAAMLPEVNAATVCAPLEHQVAIAVPLGQQVGQAAPIALLVHGAWVMAAGRATGAGDRASIAAPPGCEEVLCGVRSTVRFFSSSGHPLSRAPPGGSAGPPTRPQPLLNPSLTAARGE